MEKVAGLADNQRYKTRVPLEAAARQRREHLEFFIRRNGLENEISVSKLLRFMKMKGIRFSQIEQDFVIPLSRMNPQRRAKEISNLKLSKKKWSWWLAIIIGVFILVGIGIASLKTDTHTPSTDATDLNTNDTIDYSIRCGADINARDHERAIMDCSRAIELKPNDAHAYIKRGIKRGHQALDSIH